MWKCPSCGENLEDTFDLCWSCGTTREGTVDPNFHDPEGVEPAPENVPLGPVLFSEDEESEPLVTVAQCSLPAQAHAMRLHLEAAGIPVCLADELTIAMDWLLSNAIGGVKVQVPESYADKATELLDEFTTSIERRRENRTDDEEESEPQP